MLIFQGVHTHVAIMNIMRGKTCFSCELESANDSNVPMVFWHWKRAVFGQIRWRYHYFSNGFQYPKPCIQSCSWSMCCGFATPTLVMFLYSKTGLAVGQSSKITDEKNEKKKTTIKSLTLKSWLVNLPPQKSTPPSLKLAVNIARAPENGAVSQKVVF